MNFNIGLLNKISFIYLSISVFIFIIGWFNPMFMILSLVGLTAILWKIIKDKQYEDKEFFLGKDYLFIIVCLCLLWSYLGGIGGLFWQLEPDWHIRNALMRDLTNFSFPVVYENNVALVYYFGFMLLPALAGKLGYFITSSDNLAFHISSWASYVWAAAGLILLMLQIVSYTKAEKLKSIAAVVIFILFSGMDLFIYQRPHHSTYLADIHYPYAWISHSTDLNYVYHVVIPVWLTTILFLRFKKDISYYGIISLFLLFYCPQILIGFLIYLIPMGFYLLSKSKNNIVEYIKNVFNIKNIVSLVILCPLIYLFYKSNYTSSHYSFGIGMLKPFTYLKSFMYEVGLYLILILYRYKNDIIYYLTGIALFILPLFVFYSTHDFAFKVTILPVFILSIYVIKYLLSDIKQDKILNKVTKYILSFVLFLGALTPIVSYSSLLGMYNIHPDKIIKDSIKTLNNNVFESVGWTQYANNRNYASINYNQYDFWKYVARIRK